MLGFGRVRGDERARRAASRAARLLWLSRDLAEVVAAAVLSRLNETPESGAEGPSTLDSPTPAAHTAAGPESSAARAASRARAIACRCRRRSSRPRPTNGIAAVCPSPRTTSPTVADPERTAASALATGRALAVATGRASAKEKAVAPAADRTGQAAASRRRAAARSEAGLHRGGAPSWNQRRRRDGDRRESVMVASATCASSRDLGTASTSAPWLRCANGRSRRQRAGARRWM